MRLEGWETQINSEPNMQIERTEANHAVSSGIVEMQGSCHT